MTTFANLSSRRNFAKTKFAEVAKLFERSCHSFAARMVSCQSFGSPILTWSTFSAVGNEKSLKRR